MVKAIVEIHFMEGDKTIYTFTFEPDQEDLCAVVTMYINSAWETNDKKGGD